MKLEMYVNCLYNARFIVEICYCIYSGGLMLKLVEIILKRGIK